MEARDERGRDPPLRTSEPRADPHGTHGVAHGVAHGVTPLALPALSARVARPYHGNTESAPVTPPPSCRHHARRPAPVPPLAPASRTAPHTARQRARPSTTRSPTPDDGPSTARQLARPAPPGMGHLRPTVAGHPRRDHVPFQPRPHVTASPPPTDRDGPEGPGDALGSDQPATVPELLSTLDPASAFIADLDALAAHPAATPAGALPSHPASSDLARDVDLWLPMVGALAQLRRLDPEHRPAYLRAAAHLWSTAATRWNNPHYAKLGGRLARWRRSDPTLTLVRDLLQTLEQLESIGGVRLSYTGLTAVAALVPHASRRAGYILAQSGRPLRTLGALDAALARYDAGLRIGRAHHDRWLRARSALGAGGVHTFRGNHPAARHAFADVLRLMPPTSVLAKAAHHGLVLCTTAAGDYVSALRHGWASFRTRRADATARAEALSLLADLCTRVGRHESAIRAAQAALELTTLVRLRISLLRIALQAAAAGGDERLTHAYAAALAACIGTGGDLHEDAAGFLALAAVHAAQHYPAAATRALDAADALATRCGYHELSFRVAADRNALHHTTLGEPRRTWNATPALDRHASAVLDALAHLPTSAAELLAL